MRDDGENARPVRQHSEGVAEHSSGVRHDANTDEEHFDDRSSGRGKLRWVNPAAVVCALAIFYLFVFPMIVAAFAKMGALDSIPNWLGAFLEASLSPLGWLFDHVPIYEKLVMWLFEVFNLPGI